MTYAIEIESACQRIRHIEAQLAVSAEAFASLDEANLSPEASLRLFRKAAELHRNLAEACRQQLAAWNEMQQRLIDVEAIIEQLKNRPV